MSNKQLVPYIPVNFFPDCDNKEGNIGNQAPLLHVFGLCKLSGRIDEGDHSRRGKHGLREFGQQGSLAPAFAAVMSDHVELNV